ncbi:MAG: sugar phosphate isomerase/epimerase [Thermoleophilia bacterium]|nr:sugar phosphate isomerase/epimerase [Thermoleophilia bacterium]
MPVPRFSVCELTTLALPFEQDLDVYCRAGVDGIGIAEAKLREGEDEALLERFRRSGLSAGICLTAGLSVLPLTKFPGPADPDERVEAICAGIRRLAPFEPACVYCLTGPKGTYPAAEARRIAVDGLRRIARCAAEARVPIGLEPIHASIRDDWTLVSTIPETLVLLDEVGEPNLGIGFDVWHLWDTKGLLESIRAHARRFVGVHVNDWREPTRGWNDRALPGDGRADLQGILGALEAGGYDGWYDLEVFSDNGVFEDDYPDSLWNLDPVELITRARAGFQRAWEARRG